MHTVAVKIDSSVVKAIQQAGAQYNAACSGRTPAEHGRGPPCIHMALSMCSALMEDAGVTAETKARIKQYVEMLSTQTVDQVA